MAKLDQTDSEQNSSRTGAEMLKPEPGRDSGPVACLVPSFAEARELVTSPYSCLVLHAHRRHVALPPMYLQKKRTGIQQELNAELFKFSESLKGVPLAYDGIKIIGHHGDILDDQGFIHLNVEASFVVFKPKKGQILVGVINKIGVGHVGCLVHGCFNASVVKPAKLTSEQWRDSGLKLGDSLTFEVCQLDADAAGVLLIRGRLEKSKLHEILDSFSTTETREEETMEVAPEADPTQDPSEINKPSNPKKKKKKKDQPALEEVQQDEVAPHDVNGNGTGVDSDPSSCVKEEKKKKKKKKADKNQELDVELQAPSADLPSSDSSGYVSDKKRKKRKAQEAEIQQEDPCVISAKKKKKMK